MLALGAYLRAMRVGQRLTQTLVAEQVGINLSTLHRIERGQTEPGGEIAFNLVAAVRGSYEDARRLWSEGDASEERGQQLAEQRLNRGELEQLDQLRVLFGDDEVAEAVARIAGDRDLLAAILRLGDAVGSRRQHE